MEYNTSSEKETREAGKNLASSLHCGDIVLLYGDLGAGKTTFVKGLAEGLGIPEDSITSPTFTLMNVYEVQNLPTGQAGSEFRVQRLVHIDTYRLESEQELINIGAEDYIGAPDTVCVIEWPEKLQTLLRGKKTIGIHLEHGENGTRKIHLIT